MKQKSKNAITLTGNFNRSISRFRPVAFSVRFLRNRLRCFDAFSFAGDLNASAPDEDDSSPGATPSANSTVLRATLEIGI